MDNIYEELYHEIVSYEGNVDQIDLDRYYENGEITPYSFELLVRAFQNSKKYPITKNLSDFTAKKEEPKVDVKEVYFDSKPVSQLKLVELSEEEKEDIIASILDALGNPQNKHAICRMDNIYVSKSKKSMSFVYSLLRLPIYEYKVLFREHDPKVKSQDWSLLLGNLFKDTFTNFKRKYL